MMAVLAVATVPEPSISVTRGKMLFAVTVPLMAGREPMVTELPMVTVPATPMG